MVRRCVERDDPLAAFLVFHGRKYKNGRPICYYKSAKELIKELKHMVRSLYGRNYRYDWKFVEDKIRELETVLLEEVKSKGIVYRGFPISVVYSAPVQPRNYSEKYFIDFVQRRFGRHLTNIYIICVGRKRAQCFYAMEGKRGGYDVIKNIFGERLKYFNVIEEVLKIIGYFNPSESVFLHAVKGLAKILDTKNLFSTKNNNLKDKKVLELCDKNIIYKKLLIQQLVHYLECLADELDDKKDREEIKNIVKKMREEVMARSPGRKETKIEGWSKVSERSKTSFPIVGKAPKKRPIKINPELYRIFNFLSPQELEELVRKTGIKSSPEIDKKTLYRVYKILGLDGLVRNLNYIEYLNKSIRKGIKKQRMKEHIRKNDIMMVSSYLNALKRAYELGKISVSVNDSDVVIKIKEPRDHRAKAALDSNLWDMMMKLSGSDRKFSTRGEKEVRVPIDYFSSLPSRFENHPFVKLVHSKLRAQK